MTALRHAITAFGATAIIFTTQLAPLAVNVDESFFTLPGSILAVTIPILLFFSLVWMFWTAMLYLASRNSRLSPWVWLALAVLLLRECVEIFYALRPSSDPFKWQVLPPTSTNIIFVVFAAAFIAGMLILRRRAPAAAHRLKWAGATALAFVALSGLVTIFQVFVHTVKARHLNDVSVLHHTVHPTYPSERVVWIVLDELSYSQLYEHRFPGLALPEFDRLASESTVFTNVRPEGKLTLHVIPSLLSGIGNTATEMPASGTPLNIKNADTGKWQPFDPHQTIFQDALNDGYSTAVSGWVFPYCRLLSSVLDRCFWATTGAIGPGLNTTHSIAQNLRSLVLQSFSSRLAELRLMHRRSTPLEGSLPELYQQLVDTQTADIADPTLGFLYFHMNIPHPHGFYVRATGKFDSQANESYIDNLALCDRYLAYIRSRLEAANSWDTADIIIMGDHSWRTYGWKTDSGWTHEENVASEGGKFDDRPGYIVKLANQHAPATISTPFRADRSRAMVNAIIAQKINTPQELKAWTEK